MQFYILEQRTGDVSEFHDYLAHTLLPCGEMQADENIYQEKQLCKKEKLYALCVRNQSAFEKYTKFLQEKHAEDFIDIHVPVIIKNNTEDALEAWISFLEKLAGESYLVFLPEHTEELPLEKLNDSGPVLLLWDWQKEDKKDIFQSLWKDKCCFYIVKSKYISLFKKMAMQAEHSMQELRDLSDCLFYMGMAAEGGDSVILLSNFYDLHYASKILLK